jgi:hypothetical protein
MKTGLEWKDIAVGYSLANLWFIGSLKELIFSSTHHYFDAGPHSVFEFGAVLINILVFTVIFAFVFHLARTAADGPVGTFYRLIFLGLGLAAFCALSFELVVWLYPKAVGFANLPLPGLILVGCAALALSSSSKIEAMVGNLGRLAIMLLPFSLLIVLEAGVSLAVVDAAEFTPAQVDQRPGPAIGESPTKRVVWLIFDELDYGTLQATKGNLLQLPELSRLESRSFNASNAISPTDETLTSLPSLLTGSPVQSAEHSSSSDLVLVTKDEERKSLRETDNIFRELGRSGVHSAILGWYHPYSRIFRDDASSIFWRPYSDVGKCSSGMNGFASCIVGTFLRSLVQFPFANKVFPPLMSTGEEFMGRVSQRDTNAFLTQKATELISNSETDFLFVHFSVPHDPFIAPDNFDGTENYFSSLLVVDRTLQNVTESIERSNLADKTVLIVSSDHRWRQKTAGEFDFLDAAKADEVVRDRRVPFMIRFPGQESRIDFKPEVNTIVTKEIVENIFGGRITDAASVESWLQHKLAAAAENK